MFAMESVWGGGGVCGGRRRREGAEGDRVSAGLNPDPVRWEL